MYQGLGQMLTKCLQHHQGCPDTPKSADVICERPRTTQTLHCKLDISPDFGNNIFPFPNNYVSIMKAGVVSMYISAHMWHYQQI